jgi:hypothetical protein
MRTAAQLAVLVLIIGSTLQAGGCAGYHPRLAHPGTIEQQRLRATIHDPYPDPDLGPNYDGGRPREYQDPLPEPVRNRIYADSWWWRQR